MKTNYEEKESQELRIFKKEHDITSLGISAIQGYEDDIHQAETTKQDLLHRGGEAMKGERLEEAERSLREAGEADQAVTHMGLKQLTQESPNHFSEAIAENIDQKPSSPPVSLVDRTHKSVFGEAGMAEQVESGVEKIEKERYFPKEGHIMKR